MAKIFPGLLPVCCLLLFLSASAQTDTIAKPGDLDEVIIYSNKFAERRKYIVQKIEVISARQIERTNAQNTGDLLANTGNVFVQKSQQGGSSPVIRGFEANRVLLVIDGIRMNNAIYRAGHLQNAITIDQNMLERVEVLYGPASTLFGSDALGGVIHFRTKLPTLSTSRRSAAGGAGFVRYSTANSEKTGHVDVRIGGKKLGWLQSFNFSDFGDLKMGSNYPSGYPNFGRRSFYVANINGIDSVVANSDDRVQRFSGYRQWDITQKLLYKPTARVSHLLNLQLSNSSDVPRYDRLQDTRNGTLRFAEWYYGPQQRAMAAYELNIDSLLFFNSFKGIISYQHLQESRRQRDFRRYDRQDNRVENVSVVSFTLDARKLWGKHELTTGFDGQLNDVRSRAFRKNLLTGTESTLDTRYPNGSNRLNNFGVYAQHLYKAFHGKLIVNDGLRLQSTTLHATIRDNSFFDLPFSRIDQENMAVTGNLGLVYMPSGTWRFNSGFATGFRAPNVDDASRVFESNTASNQLIVPNPDIKPEYTYNADLGIAYKKSDRLRIEAGVFYTWFRNAIALAPFRFKGTDSITYNGSVARVYANQNVNRANIKGVSSSIDLLVARGLNIASTVNYTFGRLKPLTGGVVPLDHIPPVFGKTGITYTASSLDVEAYAIYNGWKRIRDYNPSGEDNAQYATPDGTPSWITLNLKASIKIGKGVTLQGGVENIADRNYRYFASGFSAPGRNFILALRSSFQ